jgi:collagen type I alpha
MSGSTKTVLQQQTVGDTATDWSQTLAFRQFDPTLGTLQAVDVGLTVDLTGSVSIESLEAAPATISVLQTGNVSVASPTGSSLVAAAPEASASAGFAAYDGVTDYAGASGTTFALATATIADATSSTGTMDLGPFLGAGTVALPVAATAALHVTGPANLQLLAHASVGAMVDLQYDYSGSGGANQGGGSSGVILTNGSVGLGLFGFANSVTTAAQTFSFADRATGWSDSVAADRFDPTLGTLEAVNVVLSGGLSTGDAAENEDTAAATVSVVQAATLNLALPGTTETTSASIATGMTLAGYDGAADFGGASGEIVQQQTQVPTTAASLIDPADLAAFAGSGTIAVPISTAGTSSLDGPGNLLTRLLAQAGGTVTVSYTYLPVGVTSNDIGWNNQGGGEWTDGTDWSSNPIPPQPGDNVAITLPGTYALTLDTPESIRSIVVDAPDATLVLDANLTATDNLILDAGTIVFAGGTLSAADITINGGLMTGNTIDLSYADTFAFNGGTLVANDAVEIETGGGSTGFGPVAIGAGNAGSFGVIGLISTACFARGTRIVTPNDRVPVEKLAIGDKVLLLSGDIAPIVWIGRRAIDCVRHPTPRNVWPVRIRRGAFGDDTPQRDLLLSPDHAVFVDGVLIPVKYLINESSVAQARRRAVEYFHVELPRHEVVLAEALPVESYLDTGDRASFASGGGPITLHPDFASRVWEAEGCAPLVVSGPELAAVRRRLAERAATGRRRQAAASAG